jgi:hypothetical protein
VNDQFGTTLRVPVSVNSSAPGFEFQQGFGPFDNIDVLVGDVVPLPGDPPFDPPALPAQVWGKEGLVELGPGNLELTFHLFGGDGTGTPPPTGFHQPLVNNNLNTSTTETVWFDIYELNSSDSGPWVASNIVYSVSYDGGNTWLDIMPQQSFLGGDGTSMNPFLLQTDLSVTDLDGSVATDLMLTFKVQLVPLPSTIFLFLSGLFGLVGVRGSFRKT